MSAPLSVQSLLQALLERTGWTQEDLARRLNVNQATVSRWLAGRDPRGATRDALREIAAQYGVDTGAPNPVPQRPVSPAPAASAEMQQPLELSLMGYAAVALMRSASAALIQHGDHELADLLTKSAGLLERGISRYQGNS